MTRRIQWNRNKIITTARSLYKRGKLNTNLSEPIYIKQINGLVRPSTFCRIAKENYNLQIDALRAEVRQYFESKDKPISEDYIVTVEDLTLAIRRATKMDKEGSEDTAYTVMNFFGDNNRIIDNYLEPDDRNLFYMLEDEGLLTTKTEEITIWTGATWRIAYWLLNTDNIRELASKPLPRKKSISLEESLERLYDSVPGDVWGGMNS